MKEGLSPKHGSELLSHALKHFLDGRGVADEGDGHLEALRRDVADGGLNVVGDPLNKVGRVLVLDVEHLLVDLLRGHPAAEQGGGGEVAAVTGISSAHHVLGVKHLLGQLGHCESAVLLGATGGERGKANHEEVESREGNQVDSQLPQIGVELTWEPETAGDTRHGSGHQVVKVTVGRGGQLEGPEADIIEGLVVDDHHLIGVLYKLMHGKGCIIGLDDGVGHLGGGYHGEGLHDSVGILLTDLGDEEGSHA